MDDLKGKIILDDTVYKTNFTKKYLMRKPYKKDEGKEIHAFIPGSIRDVKIKAGDKVNRGDLLLILEAMKMKNKIFSPIDGIIKKVNIKVGDVVPKNELLVEFE